MKAAVLREPGGALSVEDVAPTELQASEILVRMAGVGICHTDLAAVAGVVPLPLPVVLGHEGAGVIEKVGDAVDDLAVGDRVVLSYASCGECASCRGEHPAYCESFPMLNYIGTRLDGTATMRQGEQDIHGSWFGQSSFGTYAVSSARNAVKVDNDLPLELLGPLGCSLLTGAGTVFNVLKPHVGQSLGVWGLGTVGLAGIMAARAAGCDPIVGVDLIPARLDLALELGATHVINASENDSVTEEVLELTGGGLDFTIDAVGLESVIRQTLGVLRSPGTCATVGLQGLQNDVLVDQGHLLMGRTLTGVIEGDADPHVMIPRLIRLWRGGQFPFERLVKQFPFEAINEALEAAHSGEVIKPVVTFESA